MTTSNPRLATALAGRYRIERELGQGGMATVYLAWDLRHDRKVAIKVLRPELAAVIGAERFLSEIKTTANLQHPHILPLHDSGEADSFLFYVMPFVEGETVRDRIQREKQLPVADAVRIATEVASALDYAHRHGVIHRDIKPENILLHDGSALVADFGIALAASKAGGTRMTETGMSLGTPHYMSPEQAMGEREITARSDVYALGCVTYEMLTGDPPFTGSTAQAIVARVVTEQPRSLVSQRHTIPPQVEAAVLTALEKLPADRQASAAEFASALTDTHFRPTSAQISGLSVRAGKRAGFLVLGAAALGGLLLGAAAVVLLRPPPYQPKVSRYGLSLPLSQTPSSNWRALPSPDGASLAYVGPAEGGAIQLWIKRRDRYDATPLTGTQSVINYTWSPDGQWIAFTQGGKLKKVAIIGGPATTLADNASSNIGLAWLEDGTILYLAQGGSRTLLQVSANGGTPQILLRDSLSLGSPMPLPGGRGVLYIRCPVGSCTLKQDLWVLDFRSQKTHLVVADALLGQYVPTGHLVFIRADGAMLAAKFDLGSLQLAGPPVPVMDSITILSGYVPLAGLSSTGLMAVRRGSPRSIQQEYQMVWVDRTGRQTAIDTGWTFRLTGYGANYGWALSPDGSRLAIGLSTASGSDDIWVKQLPRGPVSRITFDSASEYRPRWMPDGVTLMFQSNRSGVGAGGLYAHRANGTGSDSLILRSEGGVFEAQFSPDRRWLLFRTGGVVGQTGGRDIVGLRPGIDTAPVPIVATTYDEEAIALSPDGRWLAYESSETGRTEVFLRPFPATESGKWQVSNGGGVAPLWARNGRELFFVATAGDMMAVSVAGGSEPGLSAPRKLFHLADDLYMTATEFYTPFDVAPDGRFIMARRLPVPPGSEGSLIIVENWLEELKARVGGR